MDRQLSTVQIGRIFAMVLCSVCCGFFITFIIIAAVDSSHKPTTNVDDTEPPRQNITQFNGEHALISGYRRQYMNDDAYLPNGVRDMVANFIGLPFSLEWRGCALVAVFPYPLDFGDGLVYQFWPDGDKKLPYTLSKGPSEVSPWESEDQPETMFYRHRVGSDGRNADQWKTVNLAVQRAYLDEKDDLQYRELATTSVDVPDFRETLRDTVSSDLKLELRPFPREDVLEPEDQYFKIGYCLIRLTRYYFGDSYKVVSTNGEPLGTSTDEKQYFESPNFQGTIKYNRHTKKWEWALGIKFEKADVGTGSVA
eukprot:574990_1